MRQSIFLIIQILIIQIFLENNKFCYELSIYIKNRNIFSPILFINYLDHARWEKDQNTVVEMHKYLCHK